MFSELTKSFNAAMYERMASPFLSSLIIFFVYFNWKAVLVIGLGDNPVLERIHEVEANYADIGNYLYKPLISSLLFSIIYPYFSLVIFAIQNYAVALKRILRDKIERNTTASIEKYLELQSEVRKHKIEINGIISDKDGEIAKLEEQVSLLTSSLAEFNDREGLPSEIVDDKRDEFQALSHKITVDFKEFNVEDKYDNVIGIWKRYERFIVEAQKEKGALSKNYTVATYALTTWCDYIHTRVTSGNYPQGSPHFLIQP